MYDVYKKGYSTLPNLKKLSENEVFEHNNSDSARLHIEKQEALKNQQYFFECENDPKFYEICEEWICKHYPRTLNSSKYLDIAKEIDEDLLIHRISGEKDWLSSAHVCFASHWKPEDKIGKSFEDIHQPVPMNLKNSRKLVETAVRAGMFERFVWSVVHDNRYNFHPRLSYSKFDKNNPSVLIKVERQVTVGFPDYDFCLFILRQYLIQELDIDKPLLAEIIDKMTPEQKMYKGLNNCTDLLCYLRNKH